MRILVTGDRGFVGTETCKLLEANGHEVIGYDLMDGYDIRDIRLLEIVCSGMKEAYERYALDIVGKRVDRILHLAAVARFADADNDPKLAFETNVLGTLNVVEIAKKYHIPLVYASTGSAYMPIADVPESGITEDMPIKGNSVYGCSKSTGELYVKDHTPHIILRYAHLYGREKRGHGLIGGFVDRISRGIAPTLYGGDQSNDFTYVKDVARANLLAVTAPWDKWNQVYNIGTGEELSAKRAGQVICDTLGYKGEIEIKEGRTVDASRFVYDMSKAKNMLGFVPEYDFKKGLQDMFKDGK